MKVQLLIERTIQEIHSVDVPDGLSEVETVGLYNQLVKKKALDPKQTLVSLADAEQQVKAKSVLPTV